MCMFIYIYIYTHVCMYVTVISISSMLIAYSVSSGHSAEGGAVDGGCSGWG